MLSADDSDTKFRKGDIKFVFRVNTVYAVGSRHKAIHDSSGKRGNNMSLPNREYKNSLFKNLFHEEGRALELYNALTDSRFTVDDGLCFTTLENVLFMDRSNDISFTIGDKLVV